MHELKSPTTLTDNELTRLLAPVPVAAQRRDAMVRINLRPGLSRDYAGPIELGDLRLSLSPWNWLKHELANTSQSVALSQQLVEARAAEASLETVAEVAGWISDNLFDEETGHTWNSHPGDGMYWGHYGVISDQDGHFLPSTFDLQAVIFLPADSMSGGIVVAQVEWEDQEEDEKAIGVVHVFGMPRGEHKNWLFTTDELQLIDSITGESCALGPDREWAGDEVLANPNDWAGPPPTHSKFSRTEESRSLPAAGLRYEAGQIYRADTNALLTVGLTHPESATN